LGLRPTGARRTGSDEILELPLSRAAIHLPYSRLVIIDNLDIKGVTVTPLETDPPLPVDPNAVLALPFQDAA
jgi:hypothetical protein